MSARCIDNLLLRIAYRKYFCQKSTDTGLSLAGTSIVTLLPSFWITAIVTWCRCPPTLLHLLRCWPLGLYNVCRCVGWGDRGGADGRGGGGRGSEALSLAAVGTQPPPLSALSLASVAHRLPFLWRMLRRLEKNPPQRQMYKRNESFAWNSVILEVN